MKSTQRVHQQTDDYAESFRQQQASPVQSNSERLSLIEQRRSEEGEQEQEDESFQSEELSHEQTEAEPEEQPQQPTENEKMDNAPEDAEEPPPEDAGADGGAAPDAPADASAEGDASADEGAESGDGPADAAPNAAAEAQSPTMLAAPEQGASAVQAAPSTLVRPLIAPAVSASDPIISSIWQHTQGATPFQQQTSAQLNVDGLHQFASLAQSELNLEAGNLAAQVDVAISARISIINAQIDAAITQTRTHFATAREKANTDIAGVRSQITAASDSAGAQISANEQQNIASLNSGFNDAQNNINPISDTTVQAVNAAWLERVQAIRDAGEEQAQVVLRRRDALQSGWQGGDGIDKDKNKARNKAASEVAAKFAAEIREKANMAANELDGGRSQIAALVSDMLTPIGGQLTGQQEQAGAGISNMAEEARQSVETQRSSALTSCDTLEQQTKTTFATQEEAAIQQLEATRKGCSDSLYAAGETMKSSILNAANGFGQHYSAMMEQLQLVLSEGGDVPPDEEMSSATDQMYADLDESQLAQQQAMRDAFSGGMQDLDGLVARAQEGIQLALNQILSGLQTAGSEISAQSQTIGADYSKSTQDLSSQMGQTMTDTATQASEAAGQTVLDTATLTTNPESELMKNLDASKDNVIGDLTESAKTANSEMKSSANTAASKVKEKPWYKKVWDALASVASVIATIVVGIVVFVAIAAFCIGTFGTGAVALIAAGAIAGAVASVASKFAGEAVHSLLTFSNKFSDFKTYMRSFVVGGLTGALSMGLGVLFPAMSSTLSLTLNSFGGAFFEQLGDIVFLGQDWHWGEFFFTGAFAVGLGKLGEKLGKSKLSNWTVGKLFPKNGVGSSWNRFQQFAAKTPILKGLNNTQRGALWTRAVKGKTGGGPYSLLNSLAVNPAKKEIKNGLVGENPGAPEAEAQEAAAPVEVVMDSAVGAENLDQ